MRKYNKQISFEEEIFGIFFCKRFPIELEKPFITMAGTILENLSGKKLSILVGTLLVCQVICFLIGGLIGKLKLSINLLDQKEFDSK